MRRTAPALLALLLLATRASAQDPEGDYARVLATAVREDGVDYDALSRDRAALSAYVGWLGAADPGAAVAERAAFRINAFNAIVLFQVVEGGARSVRDIEGFFDRRTWKVAGQDVTLDALEMALAEEYRDPRVHLALHRATKGSPPLSAALYRAEGLEDALRQQAATYLADAGRNRFEYARLTAEISAVFLRHRMDFEANRKGEVPPLQLFLADALPQEKPGDPKNHGWNEIARSLRTTEWRISFRPDEGDLDQAGGRPERPGLVWLVLYAVAAIALLSLGFRAFRSLLGRPPAPGAP